MKFKTLILVLISAFATFGQTTGRRASLTPQQQQVDTILVELVRTHPIQKMASDFQGWRKNGILYLSYQSDIMPPEMASELALVNGRQVPVITINPSFLLRLTNFNKVEDTKYKHLVIFHEVAHVANHLSGAAPMEPAGFKPDEAAKRATNVWKSEWYATKAEWELAKRIDGKHLMAAIQKEVALYGEEKGFLEGFYKLIMGADEISNKVALLRPTWKQIYLQELKKLKE